MAGGQEEDLPRGMKSSNRRMSISLIFVFGYAPKNHTFLSALAGALVATQESAVKHKPRQRDSRRWLISARQRMTFSSAAAEKEVAASCEPTAHQDARSLQAGRGPFCFASSCGTLSRAVCCKGPGPGP